MAERAQSVASTGARKKQKNKQQKNQGFDAAKPFVPYKNEMVEKLTRLITKQRQKGYDPDFISKTQPAGFVQFLENFSVTAKGYESILSVDVFPDSPQLFWLLNLTEASSDILSVVNIESQSKAAARRMFQKMLREERYAMNHARDSTGEMQATLEVQKLEQLLASTFKGASSQKLISIELAIRGKTKKELQGRLSEALNNLIGGGFGASLFSSDTKRLFKKKWLPPERSSQSFFKTAPFSISSNDLAKGYPFNHTELKDPCGFYLGRTITNGAIFWDPWRRTAVRTASNMIVLGKTGSGKSHFIKKCLDYQKALGNRIITFSKNNEYNAWTKDVGGTIVDMFDSNSRINMLEVTAAVTKYNEDNTGENTINEHASYTAHLDSVINNIRILDRTITDTESNSMMLILNTFYIKKGLWLSQEMIERYGVPKVTELPAENYPTLSELRSFISDNSLFNAEVTADKMRIALDLLINAGMGVFDGHTNIRNLRSEQVVCYDLDTLLAQSRGFVQIQLQTVFKSIVSQMLISGLRERDIVDASEDKEQAEEDAIKTLLMIDECHNLINIHQPKIAETVATSLREVRKIFGAVWLATQTPKEMQPAGMPQTTELITAMESIKKITDFMTYKFLFLLEDQQEEVRGLVGANLPDEYLEVLPKLHQGETVFMTGSRVFKMKVHFDPNRNRVYGGGS